MYPNLETVRRNSDIDKISDSKRSYLEKNCNQIFVKGPALTKEILEKVNAELMPKKTNFLGYEVKTKRVLLIAGLCLLFSLSCSGTALIWFTGAFHNYVLSQMVITNNNDSFKMWRNPTPKLIYKLHLFNYTNVDEYRKGIDEKLHVEDIGPYAYEENLERVNLKFIDDERISFQEKRSYRFRPDKSVGSPGDHVTVPNIPLISGSAMVQDRNFFTRIAFSATLRGLDLHPFINLTANDFITGYDDRLYEASRMISSFQNVETPEKFSLLAAKMGLTPRVITMNTGKYDSNKIGIFEQVDGQDKLSYFATDACNSVESGDGAVYPPIQVQQKQTLHYLFPEVCRRMPLVFEKETTILDGKVPAYRYVSPEDIFDSPEERPENQCYCNSGSKCLKGIFSTSVCTFDTPMFVSHPHFYRADPKLVEGVTGLHPDKMKLKSYMNIHPVMGFTMTGASYLQMNIQVRKAYGVSAMDMFEEELMLPIAWIDANLSEDDLPKDFKDLINFLTFTVDKVEIALKFGCLLTSLITFISLVLVVRRMSTEYRSCRQARQIGILIEEN